MVTVGFVVGGCVGSRSSSLGLLKFDEACQDSALSAQYLLAACLHTSRSSFLVANMIIALKYYGSWMLLSVAYYSKSTERYIGCGPTTTNSPNTGLVPHYIGLTAPSSFIRRKDS